MLINKNTFKKIIATLMSIVSIISLNTFQTFAVKDATCTLLKDTRHEMAVSTDVGEMQEFCERQISIFQNLPKKFAPGLRVQFLVHDSARDTLEPRLLGIYLSKINEIFENYPNITHEFMRLVEQSPRQTFFITAVPCTIVPKNAEAFFNPDPQLQINIMPFRNNTYADHHERAVLNLMGTDKGFLHGSDCRLVECTIAHEMGHLIAFTCTYSPLYIREQTPLHEVHDCVSGMNPDCVEIYDTLAHMSDFTDALESLDDKDKNKMRQMIDRLEKACFGIRKKISVTHEKISAQEIRIEVNQTCDIIKQNIIRELLRREGHVDTYITDYGASNTAEWLAEVIAYALCSKCGKDETPEPLWKGVLDWLDYTNAQLKR